MSLSSLSFLLVFLPLAVLGVRLVRRVGNDAAAQAAVLMLSVIFIGIDSVLSLLLLSVSILFNWTIARLLTASERPQPTRRTLAYVGVGANVLLLALFKYGGVARLMQAVTGAAPASSGPLIPLGLSFYTITQVMFVVDCYQGVIRRESALTYATFVSLFTNITAGPILRWRNYAAARAGIGVTRGDSESSNDTVAVLLIALGLLKKLALGNSFAEVRRLGFQSIGALSSPEAWAAALAGSFEIYFDFSGYSDIAVGCAMLLGLPVKRNFDSPFRSTNISEFWRRWHISLSEFITTYLYTPILRNLGKVTLAKSAVASVLAMLIAGLWHGASWNYAVFGAFHGGALAGYQYWKKLKRPIPDAIAIPTTFAYVMVAFALVHAADLTGWAQLLERMALGPLAGGNQILEGLRQRSLDRISLVPLTVGSVVAFWGPTAEDLARAVHRRGWAEPMLFALLLAAYLFGGVSGNVDFRYRQF